LLTLVMQTGNISIYGAMTASAMNDLGSIRDDSA
jgi:hypothetical protein